MKRQKNDAADAKGICEAAQRLHMWFVPVTTEAQQAAALVIRARDLLVKQRTQISNAICGWQRPLPKTGQEARSVSQVLCVGT